MSYLYKTPEGLLPCPHCGGEAEARDGSSTTPYIRCKSCGCRTGSSWNVDRLKEAWNSRAERTCRNLNPPSCRDFECSECGESSEFTPGFMPNYCPNCGARVEEASDDADR